MGGPRFWGCNPRDNPYSWAITSAPPAARPAMYTLFAQIARLFTPAQEPAVPDTAQRLMESAEARAGTNPRQARELRRAAVAYLRVVR